ncbi:ribosomal protein S18-alanine N-acetyltransferase [Bacillus andreraoultii]|uniref:ribosomal protein S18-alanine N-acetyltransferase n=1 Tax=Bacillus andreraoultii TaxID=1499685 RepID=UPI00053A3A27|nr:ribosomal protein S18-alanine N-acetyltransferase [Bacillus andreraoultii]
MITPVFRKLTIADVDQIINVEHASFTSPWTKDAFARELTMNPYALYIGGDLDGKIIAYGGMWIIIDEAHITNIAVLPEYRGMKIGEQLMLTMMETMIGHGAKRATLEVRVSNEIAQNMYRKFGFKNGGIRKGYYTDNYEDALVMWVNLNE